MSQDLTQQWLTEIKALKQQVAQLQGERNAGWESSEKWRNLYNTEAQQRRTEAQLSQQTIVSLKAEIQKLQGIEEATLPDAATATAIAREIDRLQSVEELKVKLTTIMKERDRLLQALKTEQESHSQTRDSLTTALGDAIDGFKHKR